MTSEQRAVARRIAIELAREATHGGAEFPCEEFDERCKLEEITPERDLTPFREEFEIELAEIFLQLEIEEEQRIALLY